MDEGWIKLHRKLLSNDELFRASSTFPVLCLLLLLANKKGVVTTGRLRLARWLKMNPSTVYSALKRLEKQKIVQQQSNNKVTTIVISNWFKYQSKPVDAKVDFNNDLRQVQQQNNTIQEYKNKEEEKLPVANKQQVLSWGKGVQGERGGSLLPKKDSGNNLNDLRVFLKEDDESLMKKADEKWMKKAAKDAGMSLVDFKRAVS